MKPRFHRKTPKRPSKRWQRSTIYFPADDKRPAGGSAYTWSEFGRQCSLFLYYNRLDLEIEIKKSAGARIPTKWIPGNFLGDQWIPGKWIDLIWIPEGWFVEIMFIQGSQDDPCFLEKYLLPISPGTTVKCRTPYLDADTIKVTQLERKPMNMRVEVFDISPW